MRTGVRASYTCATRVRVWSRAPRTRGHARQYCRASCPHSSRSESKCNVDPLFCYRPVSSLTRCFLSPFSSCVLQSLVRRLSIHPYRWGCLCYIHVRHATTDRQARVLPTRGHARPRVHRAGRPVINLRAAGSYTTTSDVAVTVSRMWATSHTRILWLAEKPNGERHPSESGQPSHQGASHTDANSRRHPTLQLARRWRRAADRKREPRCAGKREGHGRTPRASTIQQRGSAPQTVGVTGRARRNK